MVNSKDIYDVELAVDYRAHFETLQFFQFWPESEKFCRILSHRIDDHNRICLKELMIATEFVSQNWWSQKNLSHIIDDRNRICLTNIVISRDFGSQISCPQEILALKINHRKKVQKNCEHIFWEPNSVEIIIFERQILLIIIFERQIFLIIISWGQILLRSSFLRAKIFCNHNIWDPKSLAIMIFEAQNISQKVIFDWLPEVFEGWDQCHYVVYRF